MLIHRMEIQYWEYHLPAKQARDLFFITRTCRFVLLCLLYLKGSNVHDRWDDNVKEN